jgi:hypothetical protein
MASDQATKTLQHDFACRLAQRVATEAKTGTIGVRCSSINLVHKLPSAEANEAISSANWHRNCGHGVVFYLNCHRLKNKSSWVTLDSLRCLTTWDPIEVADIYLAKGNSWHNRTADGNLHNHFPVYKDDQRMEAKRVLCPPYHKTLGDKVYAGKKRHKGGKAKKTVVIKKQLVPEIVAVIIVSYL